MIQAVFAEMMKPAGLIFPPLINHHLKPSLSDKEAIMAFPSIS